MVRTPDLFVALRACVLCFAQDGKPPAFLDGAAGERFPQQPNPVVDVAGSAMGKDFDPSSFSPDARIGQTLTAAGKNQRAGWT